MMSITLLNLITFFAKSSLERSLNDLTKEICKNTLLENGYQTFSVRWSFSNSDALSFSIASATTASIVWDNPWPKTGGTYPISANKYPSLYKKITSVIFDTDSDHLMICKNGIILRKTQQEKINSEIFVFPNTLPLIVPKRFPLKTKSYHQKDILDDIDTFTKTGNLSTLIDNEKIQNISTTFLKNGCCLTYNDPDFPNHPVYCLIPKK